MKRGFFLSALLVATLAGVVIAAVVSTTLDDFHMHGSQPGQSGQLETPDRCDNCHGGYDQNVEPAFNWRGSMMAQAARDPLFYACLTIANQDAEFSGDLCIRCHSPAGWLEGRSLPTDASALNNNDREGVQCDFCHKLVAPTPLNTNPYPTNSLYTSTTYLQDQSYLATLAAIPPAPANGMYIADSDNGKRGPRQNVSARHQFWHSPYHRDAGICGTCHDVSNPVYEWDAALQQGVINTSNPLGSPAPDMNPYELFPVERTYSEWLKSDFNDPDNGQTCQDCHMRDVTGAAANKKNLTVYNDLALHDMTGGNTWIPDLIPVFFPGEVNTQALAAGKLRALQMLRSAATLVVNDADPNVLVVKVLNETGHKLPSGYPEGRRMWLNVRFLGTNGVVLKEINHYDETTAEFIHDPLQQRYVEKGLIFEAKLGMTNPPETFTVASGDIESDGSSFHFALNNYYLKDNRIPPRGFTNANFATIQASPVKDPTDQAATAPLYADGQYFFERALVKPANYVSYEVNLYYQTASKEYISFLRDQNTTNTWGSDLYTAWQNYGKSAPVLMERDGLDAQPPTTPANLAATSPKFNQVELQWDASVDNVALAGYRIYRDSPTNNIATVTGATSFTDGTVAESTTYTYYVSAFDAAQNESALSAGATVTTQKKKGGGKNKKKSLDAASSPNGVVLSVAPTTVRGSAEVFWASGIAGTATLRLYNSAGRIMQSTALGSHAPGSYSVSFNAARIPAGVYFLQIDLLHAGRHHTAAERIVVLQ